MTGTLTTEYQLLDQLKHNQLPTDHSWILIWTQLIPFLPIELKLRLYFYLISGSFHFIPFPVLLLLLALTGPAIFVAIKLTKTLLKLVVLGKEFRFRDATLLEVTPPNVSKQTSYSTTQLLNVLHGLGRHNSFTERFVERSRRYSLEIAASKDQGIKYFIEVPTSDKETVKRALLSYLPDVKVKETEDYLSSFKPASLRKFRITNISQAGKFYFPLKSQSVLEEHDPIAYLTGNMTKLKEDDLTVIQFVIKPARDKVAKEALTVEREIMLGKDIFRLGNYHGILSLPILLVKLYLFISISLIILPFTAPLFVISGGAFRSLLPHKDFFFPSNLYTGYLNNHQEDLGYEIKRKVEQPLFETSIKVAFFGNSPMSQIEQERGLLSAFSLFKNSNWQTLRKVNYRRSLSLWPLLVFRKIPGKLLEARSTLLSPVSILSSSELSDLYHLPYSSTTKTEDLVKSKAKDLPAPLHLKNNSNTLDIIFGTNFYGEQETPIGLTKAERRQHTYIIGATGTGKSNMLATMISQDISNGKGLAVIDPHGDLISGILTKIPKERVKDVVFLNPDDEDYPIGLNIMEISKANGLSESREKDFIVSSLVSLFQKLYPPNSWGTRMEYILRNAALTSLELKDPTLFTIQRLLTEKDYRDYAASTLKISLLKKFWTNEFKMAGDYQKVQMISPITNKIGRFFGSGIAKNIVGQTKSTIDFDSILNDGKILLCDLSQGKIGEDNSELLGIVTIAKIQLATLRRARLNEEDRKDFYLYVDEFQNLATPSFAKVMAEARKYRLNAILAHQTTAQIEDKDLLNVILANSGTTVSFRAASPSDEETILPILSPEVDKNELSNLPNYSFYAKTTASAANSPLSGRTHKFEPTNNQQRASEVISSSRKLYARSKADVEEELERNLLSFQDAYPAAETSLSTIKNKIRLMKKPDPLH